MNRAYAILGVIVVAIVGFGIVILYLSRHRIQQPAGAGGSML